MLVRANAKINLTLNILGKLENGYHTVDMIMQSVSLADEVTVELLPGSGIALSTSRPELPCDERNTAYKAAKIFMEKTGLEKLVKIHIEKNIPMQAGIAGGSADAAAVFTALNSLRGQPFTTEQLCDIGAAVGADVPFCIIGGTCKALGTGTQIERVENLPDCLILICKPYINVSTPVAYKLCDDFGYDEKRLNTSNVIDGLKTGNLYTVSSNLYNKFEEVLGLSEVKDIKNTMLLYGAMGALMSGSGPTVYGLFTPQDRPALEMCRAKLSESYDNIFIAEPQKHGCVIIEK